ncbi:hypothetical protein F5X68DRAFT_189849 [Plectosphaerella plurivora]|uniref:Uncharacterized protein n=1 Tax=Plectosphaerella plurivora TaxID=936078 RepID=A0A9P8VFB0_9PEZI|nr:hypothetical protein F5X68DRAFT_189849 [Plectosphaerella plurivora]
MDQDAQLDDATTRLATLTPIKDRGDGSPSAEAREQARLVRKQRNARVEAWRDIVAVSASDCTCMGSSPPSSFVDSTASWGGAASNTTATGELPSVQEPVESPATTVSAWKQDGPGSSSAAPCRHCSRLGAPSFMGEKEVDEYAEIPQPRRTSSISRMLKQFTHRIGLGDRRASDKGPIPRSVGKSTSAPAPGPSGVQPTSRDSFAESRKTKMKQTHRDRQRHESHGTLHKKRSLFGGKVSLDLNQVNEALITQSPAGHSENLTYRRAGHCSHAAGMKASSTSLPAPRDGKQGDDSLSLSSNEEDAAANPIATQKVRQATRGIERMARAQQLLNRVKDLGDPCGDETPNSRPQATAGKGGPMARRAAPPVQAPA